MNLELENNQVRNYARMIGVFVKPPARLGLADTAAVPRAKHFWLVETGHPTVSVTAPANIKSRVNISLFLPGKPNILTK